MELRILIRVAWLHHAHHRNTKRQGYERHRLLLPSLAQHVAPLLPVEDVDS